MKVSCERVDNYQKNLRCLREVSDKLFSHMMGHDYSFRPEITDKSGNFDEGKLRALVEELLSGWEETLRDGLYPDRPGGESPADPYLRARRDLYGLYLYLAMRCSLCEGAFAAARGGEEKEWADFAFLLEQAQRFSRSWCVMEGQDGVRWNEPYEGFDTYFGFHFYHSLTDPENRSLDNALTPLWRTPAQPIQTDASLTNEGNMKRIYIKRLSSPAFVEEAEEEPEEGDEEDDANYSGGLDPMEEDGWDQEMPFAAGFPAYDPEEQWEEDNRSLHLAGLAARFDGREAYIAACERFASLYRQAPTEVLRGFYADLEEIVNLYLLQRGLTPLADTDKTLDVYRRVYDGPCRQAKRYARGLQWKSL